MKLQTYIGMAIGLLTAVLVDLRKFRDEKIADPDTKFDWGMALISWAIGALSGAGLGAGVGEVAG